MTARNWRPPGNDLAPVMFLRAARRWGPVLAAAAAAAAIALLPSAVLAHTEPSAVAVPATAEATVAFQPEHGCGDSPTVSVRVQAPVGDAVAGAVDGWDATATPDGAGNTVLEWTGGLLPADEAGSFPVELTVPDAVGTLLAFPAVQRCESGEELAWIGLRPGDEYPAPQVLVLPAGSEPAATLDDVPLDAPGRDLLVALAAGVVDDAAPTTPPSTSTPVTVAPTTAAVTTTTAAPTTTVLPTTTVGPSTTVAAAPTSTSTASTATPTTAADDSGGGGAAPWLIGGGVAVVALGGGTAVALTRRDRT